LKKLISPHILAQQQLEKKGKKKALLAWACLAAA